MRRSVIVPSFFACTGLATLLLTVAGLPAQARTSNGNQFALFVSEAKPGSAERTSLIQDGLNRPHSFRYLQIMQVTPDPAEATGPVTITAFEPSSYFDIHFTVSKPVSLQLLKEAPVSKVGEAIAITGRVEAVEEDNNRIVLTDVIVRHKDRLSPAVGRELQCEVVPGGVFYSYSGGRKTVNISYQDRDLLQHRDRILEAEGKQGWADFLEREVAKRNAERKKGGAASPPAPGAQP